MMLVASAFITPYVLKEGGHVNMEYVYTLIDEKKKTFLQIFTSIICLLFFMVLFYLAWEITYEAWVKKYTTNSIWDPPLWIPYSFHVNWSNVNDIAIHRRGIKINS